MIATWMLYGTVVALLAGLGALALERGARLLGRAGRWCWVGAMVVTLALPVVAWYRPPVAPPDVVTIPTANGTVDATLPVRIIAPALTYKSGRQWSWSDLDRPLMIGWGFLSLGLLAWFATGSVRLARMRREWKSQNGLLVSDNVGPAVVGFFDCQVVVPQWSLDLTPAQRELLLTHEAEHLTSHDARLLIVSAAVLALIPWNLGLWWQFRRLRLGIELDCDQRVLRRRPDAATYGRLLIEVGSRATRSLVPVAAFHEPMSSLEHRIRALTALRPRRHVLWTFLTVLASGAAIFAACEAPRPTAPPGTRSDSVQSEVAQYVVGTKVVADSVARYFKEGMPRRPSYLWFVLNSDRHVVRWGATPRSPDVRTIRSDDVGSVIPDFSRDEMYSLTIVGENSLGPSSPPVFWAVLRDPSKPRSYLPAQVDSLTLLPWVRDGLMTWWAPLLAQKAGDPVEVWFVADMRHRILTTYASPPSIKSGPDIGTLVRRRYPTIQDAMIYGFSTGGAHGWARSNVQIVWVTLRDTPATEEWFHSLRTRDTASTPDSGWRRTPARGPVDPESRQAMLEKGEVVVAMRYPQYLRQPANPPVTIWVVEGEKGQILETHVSRAYTQLGSNEMEAELHAYAQLRPGEWFSWLPLNDQRSDVRIVWMHSNRGQ